MTSARISRVWGTILLTITIFSLSLPAYAKYSGGTGEPNDPYQIATAEDLMLLGDSPEDYDKHFILTADIDLDPNLPGRKVFERAVIAPDINNVEGGFQGTNFTGVFDGNGRTILNLTISGGSFLGLFGKLHSTATISNLGLEAVEVSGTSYCVAGLVGSNSGRIATSYSTGAVSGTTYYVGGLVGSNGGGITESYSTVDVGGSGNGVGGLMGSNAGAVNNCYGAGVITGDSNVGGLVGYNLADIATSYSTGAVSGDGGVGGLVGYNDLGSVTQCYSTGTVSGSDSVGGLVGYGCPANITHSVWDTNTSGLLGSAGGFGLATSDMMDPYTLGLNGFAKDPNWVMDTGRDYPRLAWERTPGSMIPEPEIDWLEGVGTDEDPYHIETTDQLILLSKAPILWDRHFVLVTDIDLDPTLTGRQIFGQAPIQVFTGVFDGNGHTIRHLTVNGSNYLGLFGFLQAGAEVKDLGIIDVSITGSGSSIGGLVGSNGSWYICGGTVTNCYSTGAVIGGGSVGGVVGHNSGAMTRCYSTVTVSGSDSVGGLVGENGGDITDCYSTGAVSAGGWVGGLVGINSEGTVTQCYSFGAVSGTSWGVGGLVGYNLADIATSYSTGTISGTWWGVGGLVGLNIGDIATSYSTGAVSGGFTYVGGLVGSNTGRFGSEGVVSHSFWDTQTSRKATSAGGTGKTTAEMQTAKTFLDAGWDFVDETANGTEDIWWILEGKDYPRLSWQGPAGMVFVDIPAGTFEMGDHDGVGWDDERPVHTVTLDGFQMSKYETTNGQYAEYLNAAMTDGLIQVVDDVVYASSDANLAEPYCWTYGSDSWSQIEYSQGRFTVRSRDGMAMSDHPVFEVLWYGAKAFCDYYGWRLPTEAEWEYAARGGYDDPYHQYPWGSNTIDCTKANYWTGNSHCNPLNLTSYPFTSPVGYYGPQGAYGLCDMAGNVWEWCQDWYDGSYYSVSPEGNPTGPDAGWLRVLRGGSWGSGDNYCRVSRRSGYGPDRRYYIYYGGFRVCR